MRNESMLWLILGIRRILFRSCTGTATTPIHLAFYQFCRHSQELRARSFLTATHTLTLHKQPTNALKNMWSIAFTTTLGAVAQPFHEHYILHRLHTRFTSIKLNTFTRIECDWNTFVFFNILSMPMLLILFLFFFLIRSGPCLFEIGPKIVWLKVLCSIGIFECFDILGVIGNSIYHFISRRNQECS